MRFFNSLLYDIPQEKVWYLKNQRTDYQLFIFFLRMKYEEVYIFLIEKLENDLSVHLHYHNAEHTKKVIKATETLIKTEAINIEDETLLLTAALFHDAGFLSEPISLNHEIRSCQIAEEILPQFDYNTTQIEKIKAIIMATKIPQKPNDLLEEIICDADLFYLGTDEYQVNAANLYKEMKYNDEIKNPEDWESVQIGFLKKHQFFTTFAKENLAQPKQIHLSTIEAHLTMNKQTKHKTNYSELIQDLFLMIIGVLIAGIALKGFLVPNHFFDGGVTGFSWVN
jgi:predicted metal-dependent HD superfamily phosphohydrolase